jgi:hypothetical protein
MSPFSSSNAPFGLSMWINLYIFPIVPIIPSISNKHITISVSISLNKSSSIILDYVNGDFMLMEKKVEYHCLQCKHKAKSVEDMEKHQKEKHSGDK